MSQLGLTVNQKKLVATATQVTCLGVLIDTVKGTVSIPPEKLEQINVTVRQWLSKSVVSKRQSNQYLAYSCMSTNVSNRLESSLTES